MKLAMPDPATPLSPQDRIGMLRAGCVLLSKESLKDPNFDATVVLICAHNKEGAYGLVLNRPSHMPLSEMFDGFSGLDKTRKIYIGGPVRQEELQILHVTDSPVEGALQVSPRVYLGGHWEDISGVIDGDEDALRLFLGYSGWGAGQLEFEIEADAWDVFHVNVEKLLLGPEERLLKGVGEMERYLRGLA